VKKSLSLDCIEDAFMLQHGVLKNMGFMQAIFREQTAMQPGIAFDRCGFAPKGS
jgi:hypothetical protein